VRSPRTAARTTSYFTQEMTTGSATTFIYSPRQMMATITVSKKAESTSLRSVIDLVMASSTLRALMMMGSLVMMGSFMMMASAIWEGWGALMMMASAMWDTPSYISGSSSRSLSSS